MCRMSEFQLCQIEDFQVFNEFGKIQFIDPIDVRKQDISKIFQISSKKIEVYPSNLYSYEVKPSEGEDFNKPAYLTFYNMKPQLGKSYRTYQKKLEAFVRSLRAEMIYYDNQSHELKIRVEHF